MDSYDRRSMKKAPFASGSKYLLEFKITRNVTPPSSVIDSGKLLKNAIELAGS